MKLNVYGLFILLIFFICLAKGKEQQVNEQFIDNNFENVSASNLYWDNSRTLRKDSRAARRVLKIRCINTGEVFPTLLAAATHFNMSSAGLRLCIKDNRSNRDGLKFEYVKEDK